MERQEFNSLKAYGVWYDKTHPSDFVKSCQASAQRVADAKWQRERKDAHLKFVSTIPQAKI